jgi:outer membrane receptor protein involved in Fe transport
MRAVASLLAGACAAAISAPSHAQDLSAGSAGVDDNTIVVTAQRQSESLQSVPIAVSAFSAETLEKQQIKNASDLQLTLPNVTFTKGNFTGSSFTIRGVGDLCVGASCDSATAIHVNGTPLLATRLFETEYFDLERVEVLRGPQGTLFGRNATSGVVNFITAKPDLSGFGAAGEAEYGNFDSIKVKGMANLPIGETLGLRVAGFYLNRDGYTTNIYDNSTVDGRDMYAVRGSLRWEAGPDTTLDLMAYYFHEKDDRLRSQKQLCQRDPIGVLGCLPGTLTNQTTNGNATLASILTSREFLGIALGGLNAVIPGFTNNVALGSVYGTDVYAGVVNPADPRQINTAYNPTYFTEEEQYQARLEHNFGAIKAQLTGFYHRSGVDSSEDYNNSIQNRAGFTPGLTYFAGLAAAPGIGAYFAPAAAALIPQGPSGPLCTSLAEETGTGVFGGHSRCSAVPGAFDRSITRSHDWSVEGILSSDFSGPINFLVGGIYVDARSNVTDYYVNAFGLDYASALIGAGTALGAGAAPSFSATPTYRNNAAFQGLKSYGIFGEVYYDISDKLKLTAGLRYNHDEKTSVARTTLFNFQVPYGTANAFAAPGLATFDADPGRAGIQDYQRRTVSFGELTGRAVLDYQIDSRHLLYASYSRGYKSGGINPPLSLAGLVPESFQPEFVDAFEIGSKNTIAGGKMSLNLTGFYYKYSGLQISRIVQRTSVNDNIDAQIYGVEAEAVIRPSREFTANLNFSYLHTKVTGDQKYADLRDPSGGRGDAVIIKDLTNASNCAVAPTTPGVGNAAAFVGTINTVALGLQAPAAFPSNGGLAAGTTGAFSVCSILQAAAAGQIAAVNPALAPLAPVLASFGPMTVTQDGIPIGIKGNELPQAPVFKWSAGAQYAIPFANGMHLTPRADLTFTGSSFSNIFNRAQDRIEGYAQANAQIQLDGVDDRWFVRAFIQNIFDDNSVTGRYNTDQSSGNFTNIFTLEPRRYGIAAGFKF